MGVVVPETALINVQRAAHERLSLSELVGGMERFCQIVETSGDFRMVFPKREFTNVKCATQKQLSLCMERCSRQETGELICREGDALFLAPWNQRPTLETVDVGRPHRLLVFQLFNPVAAELLLVALIDEQAAVDVQQASA